jgi:Sigma-70 region 2
MPQATLEDVLRYLRKTCAVQVHRELTDSELLARYVAEREDDVFAVFMHRHGRMVLGICKRLLADSHDAEDCFQATFLVLAQKAASIRKVSGNQHRPQRAAASTTILLFCVFPNSISGTDSRVKYSLE